MIVRNPHANSHAIIDRSILRDCRLSWAARGVLAHLLAFDDAYEVLRVHLGHASAEERVDIQRALQELEAYDYITFENGLAS